MTRIAIIGGRIVDPVNQLDTPGNVYIVDGKILAVSPHAMPDFAADVTIDAKDFVVCPGFVDINANIVPSQADEVSFLENLKPGIAAGFTHLAIPAFSSTRCMEAEEIRYYSKLSENKGLAKTYFIGALTQKLEGNRLNELMLLKEAGCIGFSNGYRNIVNTLVKRRCYDYASMFGLKIFISPEDHFLQQNGCMHEGKVSARLGLQGVPSLAETLALINELMLIEEAGLAAHFYRISTAKALKIIEEVKATNLSVSFDTTIHQLFLTENDVSLYNGLCRVHPPFRTMDDLKHLRQAIKNGLIDAISSDHITLPKQVKEIPFQDSLPGIASWPVFLPLILKLVQEENMPLLEVISCVTSKPAAILDINAGHLNANSAANITIFDPTQSWCLSEDDLLKFGPNNPFLAWQLQGKVKYTLIDGVVAYQDT